MNVFPETVRRAYEALSVPMAYFQALDGTLSAVLVTDGLCALLGGDRETLMRMLQGSLLACPHPDDAERLARAAADFARHEAALDLVCRGSFDADGAYHWLHLTGSWQSVDGAAALAAVVYADLSACVEELRRPEQAAPEADTPPVSRDIAEKIAEMKESFGSLFENLPGLSFTKDAETGVYLACNQNFAEYAHKATPAGVVGLTDWDIFDRATARHFVEDDHKALSMEEPYIFFEDVPDAAGSLRHFQTTKLKFQNDAGGLCTLGLCQDVTDLVRMIRENAVTKEAYERARSDGLIYSHIARTLIHGYMDLYYVNLDTDEYIEYHTEDDLSVLSEARRGKGFFSACRREIEEFIHPDDQSTLQRAMDRSSLIKALERSGSFVMSFRVLGEQGPNYVSMRISRMKDDANIIVLGMTDMNEDMKRQRMEERMAEERVAYARINALTGDFLCIYVVHPQTGHFREYSSTDGYESYRLPKEGEDLFTTLRSKSPNCVHPDDLARFLSMFTEEAVMASVREHGFFSMSFRLYFRGRLIYVQLKATMLREKAGERLIIGLNDIDTQIRQEEQYERRLARAEKEASIDALTGVKNKHAFQEAEERLNRQLQEQLRPEFAITILDVNDLKKVNDTAGHKVGDQYLLDACRIICDIFHHSPVFRVGGDEFAVISQGKDYQRIDQLVERVHSHNRRALREGGIVIACGMARWEGDESVAAVFERADFQMYGNKSKLKAGK